MRFIAKRSPIVRRSPQSNLVDRKSGSTMKLSPGPGDMRRAADRNRISGPLPKNLLEPRPSPVPKRARSWLATVVVILGAVFLILTLNEGRSAPYQPVIDALFYNWLVTAGG